MTFSYPVSLGSLRLLEFLKLSVFLMTLTILRNIDQRVGKLSFSGDLSNVLLMVSQRL